MAELQNGAVLPHKCQAVAHVVGIHGPTDDAVGVSDAGIQVIYQIGHMRIAVEDLREGGAFLEFQILDFIVVIVHVAEPEFGAFYNNTKLGFCNYYTVFDRIKEHLREIGCDDSKWVEYTETVRGKNAEKLGEYAAMLD